jgi:hypothetical protein
LVLSRIFSGEEEAERTGNERFRFGVEECDCWEEEGGEEEGTEDILKGPSRGVMM